MELHSIITPARLCVHPLQTHSSHSRSGSRGRFKTQGRPPLRLRGPPRPSCQWWIKCRPHGPSRKRSPQGYVRWVLIRPQRLPNKALPAHCVDNAAALWLLLLLADLSSVMRICNLDLKFSLLLSPAVTWCIVDPRQHGSVWQGPTEHRVQLRLAPGLPGEVPGMRAG